MSARRAAALGVLLPLLLSMLSGCGPSDQCQLGESRCDGHVAMYCSPEEDGNGSHNVWGGSDCGASACVVDTQGAFCALGKDPDPNCDANNTPVCQGALITQCRAGYADATHDCATGMSVGSPSVTGPCVTDEIGSFCLSSPIARDPACPHAPGTIPACIGNDIVECRGGFPLRRTSCNDATCVCNGAGAACTVASCVAAAP